MKIKKKLIIALLCALVGAGVLLLTLFVLPVVYESECRDRVFDDLAAKASSVRRSVIGIVPKTDNGGGSYTYGGGGGGVIFKQEDGVYYALTAAHVVSSKKDTYRVITAATDYTTVNDPALKSAGIDVVSDSFYDSLAELKVEKVSPDIDLAVVSFRSDKELACAELASDVSEGTRIVCMGYPDGRYITESYGTVTGKQNVVRMKSKGSDQESTETVTEHDAYLSFGSSGGPAFNEDMKLCGINIGGEFDRFEHFKTGYMLSPEQIRTLTDS